MNNITTKQILMFISLILGIPLYLFLVLIYPLPIILLTIFVFLIVSSALATGIL